METPDKNTENSQKDQHLEVKTGQIIVVAIIVGFFACFIPDDFNFPLGICAGIVFWFFFSFFLLVIATLNAIRNKLK